MWWRPEAGLCKAKSIFLIYLKNLSNIFEWQLFSMFEVYVLSTLLFYFKKYL